VDGLRLGDLQVINIFQGAHNEQMDTVFVEVDLAEKGLLENREVGCETMHIF